MDPHRWGLGGVSVLCSVHLALPPDLQVLSSSRVWLELGRNWSSAAPALLDPLTPPLKEEVGGPGANAL